MNQTSSKQKKLIIMAAGTGGHIFPGIAIAELMSARGWHVSWLGTEVGMEGKLVAQHNIAIDKIDFIGLRGKGWMHSLIGAYKLLLSFFTCIKILRKRQPDIVLGMGGYVTVPGGLAAFFLGKPLAIMNADAALLLSNKVLKPIAKKMMLGLPSSVQEKNNKLIYTGNPIRKEIGQIAAPVRRYAGKTGVLQILVMGGSLGAKALNETLPDALALIPENERPQITHQSGLQHVDALTQRYQKCGVQATVLNFIDDMAVQYAQADLVICRAGAITISELTAVGVASLLVPLVASSTSHQKENAEWLEKNGGAMHIPQTTLNPSMLANVLMEMTRERCIQMASAAYLLGKRNSGEVIAELLEELA